MTRILWHEMINSDEILLKLCDEQKKIFEKNRCYHRILSRCLKQVCPSLPWISIRFGMDWNWMHDSNFSIFLLFSLISPLGLSAFFQKKKMSSDDYWVENMLRTEVRGDFNIHRTKFFLGCRFPSKIENVWCCKPPVPLVGQKACSLHEILTWVVITENPFQRGF